MSPKPDLLAKASLTAAAVTYVTGASKGTVIRSLTFYNSDASSRAVELYLNGLTSADIWIPDDDIVVPSLKSVTLEVFATLGAADTFGAKASVTSVVTMYAHGLYDDGT